MPKSKKNVKESHRNSNVKPVKKRPRVHTSADEYLPADSDEDTETMARPGRSDGSKPKNLKHLHASGEKSKSEVEKKLKQRVRRSEAERKAEKKKLEEKLSSKRNQLAQEKEKVSLAEKHLEKLKKDIRKLKKTNEKLVKEKEDELKEKEDEHKEERSKDRKQIKSLKLKNDSLKQEKEKLESKISSISICGDPVPGPSSGGDGLFQEMLDNFRELAETQLQCAVCSEVFVEATSINCGHTFCNYCITEWMKKKTKQNCPVCRTDIKRVVQCKILDEYADKLYDQFVSEGGKLQRNSLKEEREKIKKEAEAARAARRDRGVRVRGLETVNIVLNNRRRTLEGNIVDDDSSLDSDATLELHLNEGSDRNGEPGFDSDSSDRSGPVSDREFSESYVSDIFHNTRFDSDTDSSDDADFIARPDDDTDDVTDSSDTDDVSPSSSDTSSDSDSDI